MSKKTHSKEPTNPTPTAESQGGCCGGPATREDACCALDEQVKAEGGTGCGCDEAPVKNSCC